MSWRAAEHTGSAGRHPGEDSIRKCVEWLVAVSAAESAAMFREMDVRAGDESEPARPLQRVLGSNFEAKVD